MLIGCFLPVPVDADPIGGEVAGLVAAGPRTVDVDGKLIYKERKKETLTNISIRYTHTLTYN